MTSLTINLPLPPSANKLTKNLPQGGRARTREYDAWLEEAGYHTKIAWRAKGQQSFAQPLAITIRLGLRGRQRDAGNCLKPIEDMLVKAIEGLPDDRWNDVIMITRDPEIPLGTARVTITSLPDLDTG